MDIGAVNQTGKTAGRTNFMGKNETDLGHTAVTREKPRGSPVIAR